MIDLISKNVQENKENTTKLFNNSSDLVSFEFKTLSDIRLLVIYINGLIDKNSLNEFLIKPIIQNLDLPQSIRTTVFISEVREIFNMEEIIRPMTEGYVSVFIEGLELCYLYNLSHWDKRAVEQPSSEQVVKGPKEGFIEDIGVNKALIRRKVKNNNLIFEDYTLGVQTNTKISLVYINGIVKQPILEEVKRRIEKIKTDGILDVGYIEEYIEDAPNSFISTIGYTEKPDVAVSKILEGRIGILCDGTPNVLTVPKLFVENLQTAEDYYVRPQYATFLRILRITSLFISIFLVGTFIALQTFHQEMIPTKLLVSMAGQREGVPFTSFLEALLMIMFFELIKESGLRLPKNIGSAVSVVSALILGQSAVDAGIVSPIMIIIVAISGICEFVVPALREIIIIYRLISLLLGTLFGLYGIVCGISILVVHFASLRSFGVPYLYPFAPYDKEGMKDFIIRFPIEKLDFRPRNISNKKARKRKEII